MLWGAVVLPVSVFVFLGPDRGPASSAYPSSRATICHHPGALTKTPLRASKEVGWPMVTGYASLEKGVPGDHWPSPTETLVYGNQGRTGVPRVGGLGAVRRPRCGACAKESLRPRRPNDNYIPVGL